MNLTTNEIVELTEKHDSIATEFEQGLVEKSNISFEDLVSYHNSSIIVLLGLMKLNNLTIDEMLDSCIKDLHK